MFSDTVEDIGLISIALCTFNGEKYLDLQLDSIINQTYKNIEIIICDDHSTDGTENMLNSWQKRFPNTITIYRNTENIGYNRNFEQAINYCNGDLIAISDQDDIWLPEKLSKQATLFKRRDIQLVHCASVSFTDKRFLHHKAILKWNHLFRGNDTRRFIYFNHVHGHCMVFRKELRPYIFPIPKEIYYDWWIATIATLHGNIDAVNEYLVHHRIHQSNAYFKLKQPQSENFEKNLSLVQLIKKRPGCSKETVDFLSATEEALKSKSVGKKKAFDMAFFKHLFKYRKFIFGHKKRKTTLSLEWSILKSCFKLAKS